jgi:hypothetical protein
MITDEGLKTLNLYVLHANGEDVNITNYGIEHMTNLRFLNISHNDNITDDVLINFPNLHSLDISNTCSITNRGIQMLPCLMNLDISNTCIINNEGLCHFNLEILKTEFNSNITNKGIKHMTNLHT